MALKDLDKGDKVEVHTHINAKALKIIDTLRATYNCSRATIIEAWAEEYEQLNLDGKVRPGNKPGAGRPKKPA